MLAVRENVVGNDAPTIASGKFYQRQRAGRLFVEHSAEPGLGNHFFKHGEFCAIKLVPLLGGTHALQVERPDANLRNFKGVENVHRHRVRPLIGQMTTNPAAQTLKSLADVDGLAVVIVKGIYAPRSPADFISVIVEAFKEGFDLLADGCNIGR